MGSSPPGNVFNLPEDCENAGFSAGIKIKGTRQNISGFGEERYPDRDAIQSDWLYFHLHLRTAANA